MSSSSESVFGSFPTGSCSVAGLTLKLKSDDSAKDNRQAAVARLRSVLAAFLSLPHPLIVRMKLHEPSQATFPSLRKRNGRDGGWPRDANAVAPTWFLI